HDLVALSLSAAASPATKPCNALERISLSPMWEPRLFSLVRKFVCPSPMDQDQHGCAPLHHAISHGNKEMVGLLLNAPGGQNAICVQNQDGDTPLHHAVSHGNKEMVGLLLN